jgi:sulfatase maturation enzyme AslB (radical SAM superfamily)
MDGSFRRVKKAVRDAIQHGAREHHVNVSGKHNVQIAANIGEDGASQTASAVQSAPIVQHNGVAQGAPAQVSEDGGPDD